LGNFLADERLLASQEMFSTSWLVSWLILSDDSMLKSGGCTKDSEEQLSLSSTAKINFKLIYN
jgi:hypothetical protein